MTKPQPKAEITVQRAGSSTILEVCVASTDARGWVRNNAREFGSLLELDSHWYDFQLVVKASYDPDEVAAYIRTMGAQEQADLSAFDTAPRASDGDAADTGE